MSFTKGISFHHETNASSQPTINNNISIRASNELSQSNIVIDSVKKDERVVEQSVDSTTIQNETEFLKKVLDIYMNQRFYFSGKHIILKPDELLELLTILLPDKSIVIISNDPEPECCKDAPIKKVEAIWVDNDEQRQSFKYAYSHLVSLFEDYKISIKFVRLV